MTLFQNKYRIETTHLKGWDYSSDESDYLSIQNPNPLRMGYNSIVSLFPLLYLYNSAGVVKKNNYCDAKENEVCKKMKNGTRIKRISARICADKISDNQ
jgi:hypothetical protein